jgi:hypothetical protein
MPGALLEHGRNQLNGIGAAQQGLQAISHYRVHNGNSGERGPHAIVDRSAASLQSPHLSPQKAGRTVFRNAAVPDFRRQLSAWRRGLA